MTTARRAGSLGAQSAMGRCRPTPELVRTILGHLAERVAGRLRAKARAGRTITVRVRFPGMRSVTRSHTLRAAVSATLTITEVAEQLAWQAIRDQRAAAVEITLLAVSVSNLTLERGVQLELDLPPQDPWRPGSTE
ncbi:hypothetical protein [Georgenia sp. AZ-5]|uniref:DinB/UmuC family translesion DNA polymerase n=1 Tax=Georgenia sp. AZ-5 TaxID=3367526 RepID=UPI0037540654